MAEPEHREVALVCVVRGRFTTMGDLYIEGTAGGGDALICAGDLDRLEELLRRRPRRESTT